MSKEFDWQRFVISGEPPEYMNGFYAFGADPEIITAEELYQQIKARLLEEGHIPDDNKRAVAQMSSYGQFVRGSQE